MPEGNRNRSTWMRYSGVGIEFAGAVGGFALVGFWIDRHWGTKPWALLICVALGLIGATYNLIRETMRAFGAAPPRGHKGADGRGGDPPELS